MSIYNEMTISDRGDASSSNQYYKDAIVGIEVDGSIVYMQSLQLVFALYIDRFAKG